MHSLCEERLMKKVFLILAAASIVGAVQADVIVRWNFNGASTTTVPGGATAPSTEVGTGTAALLNISSPGFNSGISNGGSSDPITTSPPNYGWQTTPYAAQGAGTGTYGVTFAASTVGYQNIVVHFDTRHSNTSSRWVRFDYSTNGGSTWTLGSAAAGTIYKGGSGDTWFKDRQANLAGDSAVNNNPNFQYRMVTIYGPTETENPSFDDNATYTQYAPSNSASTYANTGTLRWDYVHVDGDQVSSGTDVSGSVTLNFLDPLGGPAGEVCNWEVRDGSDAVVDSGNCTLGLGGTYSFHSSVGSGTYKVTMKGSTWLRVGTANVAMGGTVSGLNFTLENGDCNGDNIVDLGDFDLFAQGFGYSDGDPEYIAASDLDQNGVTDLGDFDILSFQFGNNGYGF